MTNFIITVVLTWFAKRPTHVPAWLAKLFLAHMLKKKGGNIVVDILASVLEAVVDHTTLDDKVIKSVSEKVKEQLPGEKLEQVFGKLLVQIGEELQKNA